MVTVEKFKHSFNHKYMGLSSRSKHRLNWKKKDTEIFKIKVGKR